MTTKRYSFISATAGIINYLAANSATVNSGLAIPLATIQDFRPEHSVLNDSQFPAISVDLVSHGEEPDDIGYFRKKITCKWHLGAHVKNIESLSICVSLLRGLVENVEVALRDDVKLSGTFQESMITGADFDTVVKIKSAYQRNASIAFETVSYIQ